MSMPATKFPYDADRLLLSGVSDYAIYMLDPGGIILSWNTGGERIKGYTDAEVIGQHFSRFYTADDRAHGEPGRALAIAAREGRYEAEGWRVRKDGSRFRANIVIDAIWHEGRHVGFAKITKDITERYTTQQKLRAAEQSLAQAQRINALGQLTLGIAHDFNNVLAVVTASLDLLGDAEGERRGRLIDAARQASEHGKSLTLQMLAFARGQKLEPSLHDVNALLSGSANVYRRAAGAVTRCEFDLAEVPPVMVDASQLEAALMNLVANARDAMQRPGVIRISTRRGQASILDHAEARDGADYVFITVADDGPGMSEQVRQRAMEPFFTTKDVGRGSGLGLSQVFGFASQSGGFAAIDSAPGHGTRVSIAIPLPDGTHG